VLAPGEHCLVCPPGDAGALAAAIARLLDDPGRAAALGAAARTHLAREWSPARQAARLGALVTERFAPSPAPGRRLAAAR